MTYTTASGVKIPQGTDAFNPPAQFKTWADKAATYDYFTTVPLDTDRTSLTTPELRNGLHVYVQATRNLWRYDGSSWIPALDDTGWITPTLINSWTVVSGHPVAYRRLNGLVYFKGRITGGTSVGSFVLPAGFRPAVETFKSVMSASNATVLMSRVVIQVNGNIICSATQEPNLADMAPFIAEA